MMCMIMKDTMKKGLRKHKRVHWNPRGITELYVFEIEPWRKLGKRAFSMNRINDPEESNPFVFPVLETHLEPYFDYDTYETEEREQPEPYNLGSLARCEPTSLDEVYKIAEALKQTNMNSFIDKSESMIPGVK